MVAASVPLAVNGAVLEGGGQLIRNAIALAALLSRDIAIENVRKSRKPPGLKAQHLIGLNLVAEICDAEVTGAKKGSCNVSFRPKAIKAGHYQADTQTAGSTTLLLQVSLPCLLFLHDASTLTLRGGTNAIQAPQMEFTQHVFLPFLARHFGIDLKIDVRKRGYFPKGGGIVCVSVPGAPPEPKSLPAVTLTERGELKSIKGRAFVAGLPAALATEMSDAARVTLQQYGIDAGLIDITSVREDHSAAVGAGSGIVLWAETDTGCVFGGSAIGSKGKAFADVAKEATKELLGALDHGGCVDEYIQDQIIIFLALAEGTSTIACGPLTLHTRTAIWVAELLTGAKFEVVSEEGTSRAVVRCHGIGYSQPRQEDGDSDVGDA